MSLISYTKFTKKLMIRTWFGPLPHWTNKFLKHVEPLKKHGWEFLIWTDLSAFQGKCRSIAGITPNPVPGSRKAGDYDPMCGELFQEELRRYDYWGHFNLDCVYGRLEKWVPDNFLQNLDIFGNDPGAICGPFTVYRNTPPINGLFKQCPTWKDNLYNPNFCGWDELDFNKTVQKKVLDGEVVMGSGFFQSHDHIDRAHIDSQALSVRPSDRALIDLTTGREVMMYHFNHTRRWPLV